MTKAPEFGMQCEGAHGEWRAGMCQWQDQGAQPEPQDAGYPLPDEPEDDETCDFTVNDEGIAE